MSISQIIEQIAGAVKRDDIRGVFGETITCDFAFSLGRAFGEFLKQHTLIKPVNVVVGHDARRSGPMLALAFQKGLAVSDCRAIMLGMSGTEQVGFLPAKYPDVIDGGVMVTASHNPRQYNGFKFFGRRGQPLDLARTFEAPAPETELQKLALSVKKRMIPARLPWEDFAVDYARTVLEKSGVDTLVEAGDATRIKVAVEAGNGVGGIICREVAELLPCFDWVFSHDTPDGNYPLVVPNPLKADYQAIARDLVKRSSADIALCFDGDADRTMIFDENGDMIPTSVVTALVGRQIQKRFGQNARIAHNLPSSWCVADTLGDRNRVGEDGLTLLTPVGYGKIKPLMFEMPEIALGAEHSGHYMFSDFWCADSGMMCAAIMVQLAEAAAGSGKKLSDIYRPISQRYFNSGEFNFQLPPDEPARQYIEQFASERMHDATQMFVVSEGRCCKVNEYPPSGIELEVDDVRVEFDDWWFVMRRSGTEAEKGDILRCCVESTKSREKVEKIIEDIAKMVGPDRLIR